MSAISEPITEAQIDDLLTKDFETIMNATVLDILVSKIESIRKDQVLTIFELIMFHEGYEKACGFLKYFLYHTMQHVDMRYEDVSHYDNEAVGLFVACGELKFLDNAERIYAHMKHGISFNATDHV